MEHMVEGDIKANEARAAIGIWLSVLMRRLPEAPEGEEPEPVTLTLPPELISGYGSDKMTCFGSQFDGNRDVTVVGNPGNTAATGMHGGRLTIQADSLQNSATWMVGGKLTIDGDFAVSPGFQMSGGEIVVKGSVDKQAGWQMSNGTITIEGDGGNQVGFTMTGGEIHVLGNTDESTGYRMTGGTIKVDGDIGGWSYSLVPGFMSSGTIISKFGSVNEKYFLKDGEVQEL
jgi:formylmethanofuran dehydrogenase subunit C